jgi:Dual-action HEIGH metallo-peptidase
MKKLLTFCLGISLLGLSACDTSTPKDTLDAALLKVLNEQGFDSANIVDEGDHFIVEGDMLIEKSYIQDFIQTNKGKSKRDQARFFRLVSDDKISNITVGVTRKFALKGQDWLDAVEEATRSWSSSGSKINMRYVGIVGENAQDADIIVEARAMARFFGLAGFPKSNGDPYHVVYIDTDCFIWADNIGYCFPLQSGKIKLLEHELGHTIGFTHTGISQIAFDPDSSEIPCTPYQDYDSVMSVPNNIGFPWEWTTFGLSYWDSRAAQMLYPLGTPPRCRVLITPVTAGGVTVVK